MHECHQGELIVELDEKLLLYFVVLTTRRAISRWNPGYIPVAAEVTSAVDMNVP